MEENTMCDFTKNHLKGCATFMQPFNTVREDKVETKPAVTDETLAPASPSRPSGTGSPTSKT
jgi:hypothetical protein